MTIINCAHRIRLSHFWQNCRPAAGGGGGGGGEGAVLYVLHTSAGRQVTNCSPTTHHPPTAVASLQNCSNALI